MSSSKIFFKTTEIIKSRLLKPQNQLLNKFFTNDQLKTNNFSQKLTFFLNAQNSSKTQKFLINKNIFSKNEKLNQQFQQNFQKQKNLYEMHIHSKNNFVQLINKLNKNKQIFQQTQQSFKGIQAFLISKITQNANLFDKKQIFFQNKNLIDKLSQFNVKNVKIVFENSLKLLGGYGIYQNIRFNDVQNDLFIMNNKTTSKTDFQYRSNQLIYTQGEISSENNSSAPDATQKTTYEQHLENKRQENLNKVRQMLKDHQVDAYIIPRYDEHFNEFIADSDKRIKFISGFTGTNGFCLISQKEALLFTDPRYYIQANRELKGEWKLMEEEKIEYIKYIQDNFKVGSKIGYDPSQLSVLKINEWSRDLKKKGIQLVPIEKNLIDEIWEDKPKRPNNQIYEHEARFSGYTAKIKLQNVFDMDSGHIKQNFLTSKLDEIAWVLNLRGSDIQYNPVFFAHLLVNYEIVLDQKRKPSLQTQGTLYINKEAVNSRVEKYLHKNQIQIKDYDSIYEDLKKIDQPTYIDYKTTSQKILNSFSSKNFVVNQESHAKLLKAIKNDTEISGVKFCHERDGTALIQYFAWLEQQLITNKRTDLTEYSVAQKLNQFRYEMEHNKGLSFETISCFGENSAVIHYMPDSQSSSKITTDQIYLCDSGGQYLDGTTDVTRTFHFGAPTLKQKQDYTTVLQCNIELERTLFPRFIANASLDGIARRRLWATGRDFGHGTGHGVGHFLNVHEPGVGILRYGTNSLEAGMIVSNEPGLYIEGQYGIRIENLLLVQNLQGVTNFLKFEPLTLCPYDKNLIDKSMLSQVEIDHINAYHRKVFDRISPYLKKNKQNEALEWLKQRTSSL